MLIRRKLIQRLDPTAAHLTGWSWHTESTLKNVKPRKCVHSQTHEIL